MVLSPRLARPVHRLALFVDVVPADAVVPVADVTRSTLAELVGSGALEVAPGGFRVAVAARAIAKALPPDDAEGDADARAQATWLVDAVASMHAFASDTTVLFEMVERLVPDVRAAVARLAHVSGSEAGALVARLWCGVADALFYRRALPFDAPEYALAVTGADRSGSCELRVLARIVAGRAAMETKPAAARAPFEEARAIAADDPSLSDLDGDAARGLGWFFLAGGDFARAGSLFDEARRVHEAHANTRGVADACMAQAVLAKLSGEVARADELFFRAEAILRARRDGVRVGKLGSLRAMFGAGGTPWADVTVEDWLSRGQYWRAALALARDEGDEQAQGRARILAELAGVPWEKIALARERGGAPPDSAPPPRETPARYHLRREGVSRVLVGPGGLAVDLTRRGPLTRMVEALGQARAPVAPLDLFEAAWPGEAVRHDSALYRVYTTVRRLRALGLPIATTADGYYCEALAGPE